MKSEQPTPLFTQTTTVDIASRLRSLRKARGWSLAEVEKLSHGVIKAVVLGSYERSDRALSVNRAIQLADLYGVPLSHLLHPLQEEVASTPGTIRVVIDLRRTSQLTSFTIDGREKIRIFKTFVTWIASQRSDWNGEVLSLRRGDLSTLALLTFTSEISIMRWLTYEKLILRAPTGP
jgi:transcriptional regulator with XRE-family HTH domain